MSRVTYAETQSTAEQEQLRATHQVRLVTDAEEGAGVNALPPGVYGFTYSPALPNAPMFAVRRFRSYETHKLQDGRVVLIGFASLADTASLASSSEADITLQPEPEPGADRLVQVPYERIRHHRQYTRSEEHTSELQSLRHLVCRLLLEK